MVSSPEPLSSRGVGLAHPPAQHDPYPQVTVDAAGLVVSCNDGATALLGGLRGGIRLADAAPAWLTDAHAATVSRSAAAPDRNDLLEPARGPLGEHSVQAFPGLAGDGAVTWWLVDDSDLRFVQAQLDSERSRSRVLQDISSELLSSLNSQRCMEVTAQMAAQHLADAAVIVGVGGGRHHPVTWATTGGSVQQRQVSIDAQELPGLAEALAGFPPVPSRWIDPRQVPGWAIPEEFGDGPACIGSVVVVPLPGHGLPAGAIVLLRRSEEAAFTPAEETFARLFAARAGAALSAARIYAEQSHITDVLMRDLLPPSLEQVRGIDFSGRYRASSSTDRIGGDFYDVHPADTDDGETFVVLGDVCGKGLEAAVLTGKIRNTIQALLPFAADHGRVLTLLNGALMSSHHTRFATMAFASVSRAGNRVRLRLTSAGHPSPLIIRADGRVEEAATRGTLIGALPEVCATTVAVDLMPGETCLLYSDGITEAHGGPLGDSIFGEQRLHDVLAGCAGLPAEAVTERVQMVATQWVDDGPKDDMALLAITAPRSAHLTAVDGHTRGRFTA
ncbi:PP2C family protein-serine/threonine phosphatase [Streptomyces sp. NPDC088785]|uniref:PP2C family protein-serine/threonine phosphatase n=1 Tax=Streptomyces sp. NPDC088785 TaxID=3365897 RepID=UPI0037FB7856